MYDEPPAPAGALRLNTQHRERPLTDRHQHIALIATAISEAMTNSNAEASRLEPEQSKQLAKCVVEALADAGLQITPAETPEEV